MTEIEETPDSHGRFPRLSQEQIERLSAHGDRRSTEAGEVLFHAGDTDYDFFVVLHGKVATEGDDGVIAVHGPGRFLGELSLLTGQAALFTAIVREPGEVLVVPVARLRALVSSDPALGDVILRAYLLRREMLIGLGAGFKIVGSRFSPATRRLREFAVRNRLPHRWIDLEDDPDADALLRSLGIGPDETPVVIWDGDRVLRNPSIEQFARVVGLRPASIPDQEVWDLIIAGAGPSGLAAAVYGASEGLATVVLDAIAVGGQAGTTMQIENYLGFPAGISGIELATRANIQASKFGARVVVPADAASLSLDHGNHVVGLADGTSLVGRAVVIATGAHYRRLDVPDLERFESVSVFYEATLMEALVCAGDPVVLVGGGNSAGQAALFLARHAARVRLLIRGDDLRKDMSRYLADRIEASDSIDVSLHTEVRELVGDERGTLEALIVEDNRTGERQSVDAKALFVFIGAEPCTPWLAGEIEMDQKGFVLTGAAAGAESLLQTSRPGVLAVGDVRSGSIKRVASAVGEGSMAVRLVHDHLGTVRA
ncbi:MAG TPA: FAD-dependent oxidoreductase [Thermoleophilaceae bacterium]|nr:FAD-dependent oxidoreductase [Thermoleophilaceae bacterium]